MIDSSIGLHTLKIRDEYRRLVLPHSEVEIKCMEEDIRCRGCIEPISIWSGRLLVDYERYEIFHRLKIPFRIVNNSARNSEEVIEWICRSQLQRTDITAEMRRYLIGRQYLALKLLGAHYAASTPQPSGRCRLPSIGAPKYEPAPIRIREKLGKIYHIRQETVERYAAYMAAIDIARSVEPNMADGLLSGRLKLTVDRVLELLYKTPEEIRKIGVALRDETKLENRHGAPDGLFSVKRREAAAMTLPSVSIKNMPSYDPDAEISSLTLTIPTWVSSVRRVNSCVDFAAVTTDAKQAARKELLLLKSEVESILHHMKKEG